MARTNDYCEYADIISSFGTMVDPGSSSNPSPPSTRASFNEFEDRDFADWKRIRSAIEHENLLTNHRLTWLFSTQGFLLTAYVVAFNQWAQKVTNPAAIDLYRYLFTMIALAGIVICMTIQRSLRHGFVQLRKLDDWWNVDKVWQTISDGSIDAKARNHGREKRSPLHPPIQGSLVLPRDSYLAMSNVPGWFIFIWTILASSTVGYYVFQHLAENARKDMMSTWAWTATIVAAVAVVGWSGTALRQRIKGQLPDGKAASLPR